MRLLACTTQDTYGSHAKDIGGLKKLGHRVVDAACSRPAELYPGARRDRTIRNSEERQGHQHRVCLHGRTHLRDLIVSLVEDLLQPLYSHV